MSDTTIVEILAEAGPLTGAELLEKSGLEPLDLWRRCSGEPLVTMRIIGRRYLRLDRNVDGYARLSPSIRREFLTYTLLDHVQEVERLDDRARTLAADIEHISEAKRRLASQTISALVDGLACREEILKSACFVLAGDIVYNMAHRVPRPEHSTGKMVRGSDLDVVVVVEDSFDPSTRAALDDAIYQKKYRLLVNPSYREELDYLIKDLTTVKAQIEFDTFEHMVACKILDEGEFIYGSMGLFLEVKGMLKEKVVRKQLSLLSKRAAARRAMAERTLRLEDGASLGSGYLNLFYTSDEGDEIY